MTAARFLGYMNGIFDENGHPREADMRALAQQTFGTGRVSFCEPHSLFLACLFPLIGFRHAAEVWMP